VPETWATGLELQVDNGNDAPLELLRVRLRQPQPDIFLIAPAGEYSMLLGNADDFAPRYEIDRVRSLILSVSTGTATVGPLGANPRFQRSARLASAGSMERLALWTILGIAVLVLSAITLRMAQREKSPPDTQPPPDAKV